jgi:FlaA1/EpsC-like NDP-sugar epimerase
VRNAPAESLFRGAGHARAAGEARDRAAALRSSVIGRDRLDNAALRRQQKKMGANTPILFFAGGRASSRTLIKREPSEFKIVAIFDDSRNPRGQILRRVRPVSTDRTRESASALPAARRTAWPTRRAALSAW